MCVNSVILTNLFKRKKLTVTRGEDNGGKGGRVFRNIYKGHMQKTIEG